MPRPVLRPAFSGTLLAAALQNAWVLGAFALVFVAARAVDVRLLRAAAARRSCTTVCTTRTAGCAAAASLGCRDGRALRGDRQPVRGRAARRRAALHRADRAMSLLGGAALFAMALGMGAPLIVVGVSEGALLPRAGAVDDGRASSSSACCCWRSRSGCVSPVLPAGGPDACLGGALHRLGDFHACL